MNGFPAGPEMEPPRRGGFVTALAVLNISFGLLCGCLGLVQGVFAVFFLNAPEMIRGFQKTVEQARAQKESQFDAEEEAAPTEEARAAVETRRAQWRRTTPVVDFEPFAEAAGRPAIRLYAACYAGLSMLGNALLLASGIGLLGRRSWGRSLAIGTAVLKMAGEAALTLLAFAAFSGVLEAAEEFMDSLTASLPPGQGPPPGIMGAQFKMMTILQTGLGLALAAIYPTILLVVLLSRSVKAEFREWE